MTFTFLDLEKNLVGYAPTSFRKMDFFDVLYTSPMLRLHVSFSSWILNVLDSFVSLRFLAVYPLFQGYEDFQNSFAKRKYIFSLPQGYEHFHTTYIVYFPQILG